MFIRAELKQKAKENLHRNLWLCIGVTFVFGLLTSLIWLPINSIVQSFGISPIQGMPLSFSSLHIYPSHLDQKSL